MVKRIECILRSQNTTETKLSASLTSAFQIADIPSVWSTENGLLGATEKEFHDVARSALLNLHPDIMERNVQKDTEIRFQISLVRQHITVLE